MTIIALILPMVVMIMIHFTMVVMIVITIELITTIKIMMIFVVVMVITVVVIVIVVIRRVITLSIETILDDVTDHRGEVGGQHVDERPEPEPSVVTGGELGLPRWQGEEARVGALVRVAEARVRGDVVREQHGDARRSGLE